MVPKNLVESPFNHLYIYIYIYIYIHIYIYIYTQFLFRTGTLTIPPEDLFFLKPSVKVKNWYLN